MAPAAGVIAALGLIAACSPRRPPRDAAPAGGSGTSTRPAVAEHARAAEAGSDSLPFAARRLADGVYAVPGDTGRGSEGRPNAGFIVTSDGVVVIDALASPLQGRRLVRTVRTVTPAPIRWLILTHHHPDHHFGAIIVRREGARAIAHPNRTYLAVEQGEDDLIATWVRVVGLHEMRDFEFADVPDVPITGDTTLRAGGRTIVVSHPGAAHSPGDLTIWLPSERVLFAGDLLIEDGVTMVVDGNSGVLLSALDRLEKLGARVAVPGHGRITDDPRALFALTRAYVTGLRATMRDALARGTPMGRVLARMPKADENRPVSRASREQRNAVRVYLEMEREMLGFDTPGKTP